MTKKIGNINSCNRCPLRIHREVICEEGIRWKSFCVGGEPKDKSEASYSYFICIQVESVDGLELKDLSIIHPDCPLEDDSIEKQD